MSENVTNQGVGTATMSILKTALLNQASLTHIPKGWEVRSIESLCVQVTSGGTPLRSNPVYWTGGTIPWLKTSELKDTYVYEAEEKITKEGLANYSAKLFPVNTILMAMYGDGRTITSLAILGREASTNQACCAMIADPTKCHYRYLFYALKYHRNQLIGLATGSSQRNLSGQKIKQFGILVPPLPTQQKIAAILSAYDDLIENNIRRIAVLESMARLIYREWFVHFRFPGHENVRLVESEVGPVPEGWELVRLGDIAQEVRRSIQPEEFDPETPYVGLEHIPRKSIALTEWGKVDQVQSTKLIFKKGEILFGKIRPYFHKVVVAPVDGICSTDAIVILPKKEEQISILLCCVSSEHFVEYATTTSQGTKMPRADWKVLTKYPVALPPKGILERFNALLQDIRHVAE